MSENPSAWPGIVLHGYNLRYLEAEIGGLHFEASRGQKVSKILSQKNPSSWRSEFKPQTPGPPKKDRKLLWLKELKSNNRTLWLGWSQENLPRNIFPTFMHYLYFFTFYIFIWYNVLFLFLYQVGSGHLWLISICIQLTFISSLLWVHKIFSSLFWYLKYIKFDYTHHGFH
jgi:hypothetical protein